MTVGRLHFNLKLTTVALAHHFGRTRVSRLPEIGVTAHSLLPNVRSFTATTTAPAARSGGVRPHWKRAEIGCAWSERCRSFKKVPLMAIWYLQ